MRRTRALAAAATGTLGPLCAAAWLVAFLRGERCLAHCRARERCLGSLVWETASVVWALERTKEQERTKQLQKSCVPLFSSASSRPLGPSRRPRSCGHRSLSRTKPTPRVLTRVSWKDLHRAARSHAARAALRFDAVAAHETPRRRRSNCMRPMPLAPSADRNRPRQKHTRIDR